MRNSIKVLLTVAFVAFLAAQVLAFSSPPSPPGKPSTGYGSTENYISPGYTKHVHGGILDMADGMKYWIFEPDVLLDGDKAPVVVFLHGFLLCEYTIYEDHIRHLVKQGYIVIYPQYTPQLWGLPQNLDQPKNLDRVLEMTEDALANLGSKAGDITIYGHSLGGLLAMSWQAWGGPPVKNIVVANPQIDPMAGGAGVPEFMSGLVDMIITLIDWQATLPQTTVPIMVIYGEDDSFVSDSMAQNIINALGSTWKSLYQALTDTHGDPELPANHMAPISDDGIMPGFIMEGLGGDATLDAYDYRIYWAALDGALRDDMNPPFDTGSWSDGQSVKQVIQLY